jgi:hypothetical protein
VPEQTTILPVSWTAERTARAGRRSPSPRCPEPGCAVVYASGSDRYCAEHAEPAPSPRRHAWQDALDRQMAAADAGLVRQDVRVRQSPRPKARAIAPDPVVAMVDYAPPPVTVASATAQASVPAPSPAVITAITVRPAAAAAAASAPDPVIVTDPRSCECGCGAAVQPGHRYATRWSCAVRAMQARQRGEPAPTPAAAWCECGCGRSIAPRKYMPRFATDSCRRRAMRARRALAAAAEAEAIAPPPGVATVTGYATVARQYSGSAVVVAPGAAILVASVA